MTLNFNSRRAMQKTKFKGELVCSEDRMVTDGQTGERTRPIAFRANAASNYASQKRTWLPTAERNYLSAG